MNFAFLSIPFVVNDGRPWYKQVVTGIIKSLVLAFLLSVAYILFMLYSEEPFILLLFCTILGFPLLTILMIDLYTLAKG